MPRVSHAPAAPGPAAAAIVYVAALVQGLALVSFPAASALLKEAHGLTDAQYGAIFLPQVTAAVLGALTAGAAARRVGLSALLVLALLASAGSQGLLAATAGAAPATAYALLLAATALAGAGFGIAGAPLNSYPGLLFPARRGAALVALHTAIGVGFMGGPLAVGVLGTAWIGYPAALSAVCGVLAAGLCLARLPQEPAAPAATTSRAAPAPSASPRLWGYIAVAVLYAFAEGTFANWAPIYLAESKRLPMEVAAAALSVFWGALVVGRLLASALLLRLPPRLVWSALPCFMIAAFLLLPYANTSVAGLALFALAGLGCSAFFPLTVALLSEECPGRVAWASSMLTAALMLGVGVASFAVGALRMNVSFEALYRLSAFYPALILALIVLVARRRAPVLEKAAS